MFVFISPKVVLVTVENVIRSDNILCKQQKMSRLTILLLYFFWKFKKNIRAGAIYHVQGRTATRIKGIF